MYEENPDDQLPPHNLAAEKSVLGGMLMGPAIIPEIMDQLQADDFFRPAHQIIYQVIQGMFADGSQVDPVKVAARLEETGQLSKVGGAPYLHTLIASCVTPLSSVGDAKHVANKAVKRRTVEAGRQITAIGWSSEGDAYEGADRAQSIALDITSGRIRGDLRHLSEIVPSAVEEIDAAGKRDPDKSTVVPTGFTDLDSLFGGGLTGGQFVVIGARPALGKSSLALNFAQHAAVKRGLPVAVYSLEMGRTELATRLISSHARIPMNILKSGELEESDWDRMSRCLPDLNEAPLWIDDTASRTVAQIRASARRHQAQYGLRMIVVDYLQLMTSPPGAESRQIAVGEMSRQLKIIAKELEIPVVALSQLNRGPEQRQDKKPMLADLRESGNVEQDADIVILLNREDAYERESPRAGEADLIVAKHRNGPTATVTVAFQGHYSRFVDMAPA